MFKGLRDKTASTLAVPNLLSAGPNEHSCARLEVSHHFQSGVPTSKPPNGHKRPRGMEHSTSPSNVPSRFHERSSPLTCIYSPLAHGSPLKNAEPSSRVMRQATHARISSPKRSSARKTGNRGGFLEHCLNERVNNPCLPCGVVLLRLRSGK